MHQIRQFGFLASAALVATVSAATAPDVRAQGQNTGMVRMVEPTERCPAGWGVVYQLQTSCKPDLRDAPSIYRRASKDATCADGYFVDYLNPNYCNTRRPPLTREQTLQKDGILPKPNALARCPTGWVSSNRYDVCSTSLSNAPVARAKGNAPCSKGELDDWGLWCTSNYAHLTLAEVERAGLNDFNSTYAYALNDGLDANSIPDSKLSPAAAAYFNAGTTPVASSAGSGTSTAQAEQAAQTAKCQTGSDSAVGAAIGGAVGGQTGAALGGMLGGLSKKKKKGGC